MRNLIKRALHAFLPGALYIQINAWVAARDIRSGKRTEPEIAFLNRFVSAGDRVIDVGANHGLYANHLSRLVGGKGEVHCFEPVPYNLAVLNKSISSLKLRNVTIHPLLCGDERGVQLLHVPETDGLPAWGLAHLHGKEKITVRAEMVRLDDVISGPIQFIKCDAEGAESFVLRGASEIIRKSRPTILVEVDVEPAWTERLSLTPQQALSELLLPLGYKTYRVSGEELLETDGFIDSGNYFLVPPERSLAMKSWQNRGLVSAEGIEFSTY